MIVSSIINNYLYEKMKIYHNENELVIMKVRLQSWMTQGNTNILREKEKEIKHVTFVKTQNMSRRIFNWEQFKICRGSGNEGRCTRQPLSPLQIYFTGFISYSVSENRMLWYIVFIAGAPIMGSGIPSLRYQAWGRHLSTRVLPMFLFTLQNSALRQRFRNINAFILVSETSMPI